MASSRRRRIRTRRLWGSTGSSREESRDLQQLFTELKPRYFAACNSSSCSFKPHRLWRVATLVRGKSLEHRLFLIEQINFLRASPAIAEPRAVENIALQREGLDV